MSNGVIAWAKRQKTGSPTRKAVLVTLAAYAAEHGEGWPDTCQKLAEETELSVRTVRNALRELVAAGIIERHERGAGTFIYILPADHIPVFPASGVM